MPAVSIVIPCFNAARFLDATIASAQAQTGVDWELIVVDDGSTDSSRACIDAWQSRLGSRLRSHFGPNLGASAARNTGTQMAHGEFIQYLDADDLLRPGTLAKRVDALQRGGDVAYCDWQQLLEEGDGSFTPGLETTRKMEDVHPRPEIALFTSFWCPPVAMLYRSKTVAAIGGWNLTLPVIQDARFALDAAMAGARFVHVPGIGADYRVLRGHSLSSRDPVRFVLDCFRNACQVEDRWRAGGGLDADQQAALAACYDYTARTLLQADYPAFQQNLARLYRVQPGFRPTYPKLGGLAAQWIGPRGAAAMMRQLQKVRSGRPAAASAGLR
jgi:glycosyltransferase involved in cell wall biosynthesis